MTSILSALLVLVPAPEKQEPPTGAPPTLQYLVCDEKGAIEHTVTVTRYVPQTRQITVTVNGRQEVRTVTEVAPTTTTERRLIDSKGVDVYDLDGKKVDQADWQKALKGGAVVAMAADGNVPHAAYRKALKAGTLIVVPKAAKIGPAPPPVPQPLPIQP